jgi:glutaredoxin-like protein NrdH
MYEIKVYTKENCPQCKMTKKVLDDLGIKYVEIDVEDNEIALEHLSDMGFQSLPVVEFGNEAFSGFQPNKLEELGK